MFKNISRLKLYSLFIFKIPYSYFIKEWNIHFLQNCPFGFQYIYSSEFATGRSTPGSPLLIRYCIVVFLLPFFTSSNILTSRLVAFFFNFWKQKQIPRGLVYGVFHRKHFVLKWLHPFFFKLTLLRWDFVLCTVI